MKYKILSWNVNGYSTNVHEWVRKFLINVNPDVLFLSETKKSETELSKLFNEFSEYQYIINSHVPSKWHGVAMLIKKVHHCENYTITMNIPARKDSNGREASVGRIIAINFNNLFYIIGSYTPNSGRNDKIKLDYRTNLWDYNFTRLLDLFRKQGPVMWIGDINVALDDIDVSHPKKMSKYAGFTIEERSNLRSFLADQNWIDVWRYHHNSDILYTWLGESTGMRLDNIIVSKSMLSNVDSELYFNDIGSLSDHIVIGVIVDF